MPREERSELEGYLQLNSLLTLIHSKARVALKRLKRPQSASAGKRVKPSLRTRVRRRARGRCEYCRISLRYTSRAAEVDHIIAE